MAKVTQPSNEAIPPALGLFSCRGSKLRGSAAARGAAAWAGVLVIAYGWELCGS